MVTFERDKAHLRVNDHFAQGAAFTFKQYLESANEEYKSQVVREHQEAIRRERGELQRRIAEQEQRARVLKGISV
jgi:hypothetical protein